ncbi:hypothetical protein [Thalassotalea profundi]|uniref:Anti-sigma factor n=1 Tax=Thalassotalea profundi TaxID=2036687 RepID=A0ABQ3IH22_9GAMM|nr:hypothetical protein [Thalassotalea profundi]GHE81248.1 hypothetical protein GCM10011501_06710 [Thalassotalea profundi]
MKAPNDKNIEQQFSQWLDQQQENTTIDEFTFEKHSQWHERENTARYIAHQIETDIEEDVPNWNRGSAFVQDKSPWWQWHGLPAMSMAFSLFALSLVIFKVDFTIKDGAMMISFSGNETIKKQADIELMIDQKLQSFASEQQVLLANYAADIKVKQQDNNLQLASYILNASRKERKEDIGDFVQYINEQRADEQFNNQMKFKQLEQALFYKKSHYDEPNSTPANWITEE